MAPAHARLSIVLPAEKATDLTSRPQLGASAVSKMAAAERCWLLAARCLRSKGCRRLVVLAACVAVWSQVLNTQGSGEGRSTLTEPRPREHHGVPRLTGAGELRFRQDDASSENDEMFRRQKRIRQACESSSKGETQFRYMLSRVPIISRDQMYLHCPVTKAASTFWTRFLLALNGSGHTSSPFAIPLKKSNRKQVASLLDVYPMASRIGFISSATKVVFVRDPYSRMFSAYVDKVFAPNPYYWRSWGKRAISKFRENAQGASGKCGSDVTFAEVMAFAASGMFKSDIHFHSVFRECQPCAFHYDFVGKMETFAQDIQLLVNKLQLPNSAYFSSQQFRDDFTKDAIEDSINSPWEWLREVRACMTMAEAGKRVWRKLQIRGIISRRIAFPFRDDEAESLTAETFIHSALSAHRLSTDKEELKRQKREAMVEAFLSVDSKTLNSLRNIFARDFELFDYEPFPADLLDRTNRSVNTGAFQWDEEWKED